MALKEFFGIREKKKKIYKFEAFPEVIQTKIYKQIGLIILTLIATIIFIASIGKANIRDVLFMAGLGLCVTFILAYLTYTLYIIAATGDYDVYEGICIANDTSGGKAIKVIHGIRKVRTISFESADGTVYKLYCKDPGMAARTGHPITVYAAKRTKPLLRHGEYVIYQYLAVSASPKRELQKG